MSETSSPGVDLNNLTAPNTLIKIEAEPLFPLPPTLTGQAHNTEIQLQARRAVIKKLA